MIPVCPVVLAVCLITLNPQERLTTAELTRSGLAVVKRFVEKVIGP